MNILISLFLSISLNLYGAEVQNDPLVDFDKNLVKLSHNIQLYLKQLEGSQGCRFLKVGHAILRTERRKWCQMRRKDAECLIDVIESKVLTSRNKMAAIENILTEMEKAWENFEKTQPEKSWAVCREPLPEELQFFDGFASYFHEKCKEQYPDISLLMDTHPKLFPELVCTVCLAQQPQVMYQCNHFQICLSCHPQLTSCPACRASVAIKKKPLFFARCKGCHKENVDTICDHCEQMELCQPCSQIQVGGKFVHSCSSILCKLRQRKIEKCFPSYGD